jgi:DNA (cytosine-5)-methyltransferase 1
LCAALRGSKGVYLILLRCRTWKKGRLVMDVFNYECEGNMTIFDFMYPTFKIDKPIRLIELFGGVGSQAMALRDLGADFEHYKLAEWEVSAFASYKAIHMSEDNTNYSEGISQNDLINILFDLGISNDGKNPMTLQQIGRKNEKWLRTVYNNIKATHNLVNIMNIKGSDYEIVDTDKFIYIMTYSFPCQDLSSAGLMKGMKKGSGTRSGTLWEVERNLNEMEELPQILLMENVPEVIGSKNIKDFQIWQEFLESKGYTNYVEILTARDFDVAQNRERCFMVSLLGQWNYKFPQPVPLTKTMADYLEERVEKKYYIDTPKAKKLILELVESGQLWQEIIKDLGINRQME